MLDFRGWFVISTTPARGQLFINSVTLYTYDATDIMDSNNVATILDSFFIITSLQPAQVNTEKVSVLNPLVLAKKWGISSKNILKI